jgi:hypothetical protein
MAAFKVRIEEPAHQRIDLLRFRQVRVVKERVAQALKDMQVGLDTERRQSCMRVDHGTERVIASS